jgi:poly(ADP-ribose) glycohydrolase ARH3
VHSPPTPPASSPLRHIRNSLLLAACADRLAAPLHGIRLPSTTQVEDATGPRTPEPSQPSHLITQLLLTAEHLAQHDGALDEDQLAWTLAQHPPTDASRGGNGTAAVLSQVAQGIPWWQAAPARYDGQGSHGSTAAIRGIAAGLLPHTGIGTIAELARRTAVITHTHQLARDAAAVTATAVALAARSLPNMSVATERFLATAASQAHHPEFTHYLSIARTLTRHRAGPAETIATLNSTSSALRTVPAALTAYLRHPTDPVAAIRYALTLGGHTLATATITAALAGARNPGYSPPPGWRTNVDSLRIHTVAAALASLKNPDPHSWRRS